MPHLTAEQRAFYADNGYLHVRGLIDPATVAACRAELHALAERREETDATWASVRGTGTRITHCHDVQFESAAFTRLLVDPRLTEPAEDIIGPNVQLHHTKMFIKPPERGAPFPMHQDYPYLPHEKHTVIAVIIHFDDAPVEKGCVTVVPGSHRRGPLDAIGEDHHLPDTAYDPAEIVALPAEAGDAIFMSYLLIHGSGVNVSAEPRTTVLVQLRDPEDVPLNEKHASRGQGMMLAGIDPRRAAFRFAWAADAA